MKARKLAAVALSLCLKLIYYPIVHCLSGVVYIEEYILKTFKTIKRKITMH